MPELLGLESLQNPSICGDRERLNNENDNLRLCINDKIVISRFFFAQNN